MISVLFSIMVLGGILVSGGALFWLFFSRNGIRGIPEWTKRFDRLEAEVKRLSSQDTRLGLDDEVRRLDEKVEFLENLLAERAGTDALPPGGEEESRRALRKP